MRPSGPQGKARGWQNIYLHVLFEGQEIIERRLRLIYLKKEIHRRQNRGGGVLLNHNPFFAKIDIIYELKTGTEYPPPPISSCFRRGLNIACGLWS